MKTDHYAVVIGIDWYPGLDDLTGAVSDAARFEDWLLSADGGNLPPGNIRSIRSPPVASRTVADPIKTQIDDALDEVRTDMIATLDAATSNREDVRRASRLYVFAAGHGVSGSPREVRLLDASAKSGSLRNLNLTGYLDYFVEDGTFGEICMFADCCRLYEPDVPDGPVVWNKPIWQGEVDYVLGMASAMNGRAYEPNGRGLFTHALLDGLSGHAPATGGVIAPGDLATYVSRHVEASDSSLAPQRARFMVESTNLVFSPGTPQPRQVRLSRPPGNQDVLAVSGGRLGAPIVWAPDRPKLMLDLLDGQYMTYRAGTSFDDTGLSNTPFEVIGGDLDVQL